MTPQEPHPAVPTLREAEAARNTSDDNVERQLPGESARGNSLPDVPPPDVPPPDGPLPDVPVLDYPVPEARPDHSVGEEGISPQVAEVVCVQATFGFLSCEFLCCDPFISGTD